MSFADWLDQDEDLCDPCDVATATPATLATVDRRSSPSVATVATVAVARTAESQENTPSVATVATVAGEYRIDYGPTDLEEFRTLIDRYCDGVCYGSRKEVETKRGALQDRLYRMAPARVIPELRSFRAFMADPDTEFVADEAPPRNPVDGPLMQDFDEDRPYYRWRVAIERRTFESLSLPEMRLAEVLRLYPGASAWPLVEPEAL